MKIVRFAAFVYLIKEVFVPFLAFLLMVISS